MECSGDYLEKCGHCVPCSINYEIKKIFKVYIWLTLVFGDAHVCSTHCTRTPSGYVSPTKWEIFYVS
jgi:predicted aldo/keto reductase-like oxidoreductase